MTAHFDSWVARARAVPIERETDRRGIKLRGAVDRVGPCPKCGGEDRFAINTKKGAWNCRGCGVGGDVIKLVEHLDGCDFKTACETLTGKPAPSPNGKGNGKDRHSADARKVVVAEFEYCHADGTPAFVVERVELQRPDGTFAVGKDGKKEKTFRQRRPDPDRPNEWIWNVEGVPPLLYRLPEITEAIAIGCVVLIVEGEAKADLLWQMKIPATCCACGAKKWKAEHSEFLRDASVVVLPDNDVAGREHLNVVATSLQGVTKKIRVLDLPGLRPKGDVIDWAANGGTVEQLHDLIGKAPYWLPPISDSAGSDRDKSEAQKKEDELLEALSRQSPGVAFARDRKRAARQLGVSISDINAEIEARRDKAAAPLYGHWINEPWPEVADGDSLLRDIVRRLRRHVVCSADDALAIALWIMAAWVHEAVAVHSPILLITSAQPEAGKSTALGLIKFLAPICIAAVEISEAALFRAIQKWKPSFAIDEFDTVLTSDDRAALRSVINSGHTRGTGVIRCIPPSYNPQLFHTFSAKAIGMVGRKLPDATLGRCIIVELRRRKSTEPIEKFAHRDDADLAQLRSRLMRWAVDNEDTLRDAKAAMPDGFDNRRADNWWVMFSIADLAGEDWGDKARVAASQLERASDTTSVGVQLLADIKRIFDEEGCDAMLSSVLVDRLKQDEEQPWVVWGKQGKGLTQNSLAVLLSGGGGRGRGSRGGFNIRPGNVRLPGDVQGKGYKRSQFEDAWARYLPAETAAEDADSPQPPE